MIGVAAAIVEGMVGAAIEIELGVVVVSQRMLDRSARVGRNEFVLRREMKRDRRGDRVSFGEMLLDPHTIVRDGGIDRETRGSQPGKLTAEAETYRTHLAIAGRIGARAQHSASIADIEDRAVDIEALVVVHRAS